MREDRNGFQVHLLNRSDTTAVALSRPDNIDVPMSLLLKTGLLLYAFCSVANTCQHFNTRKNSFTFTIKHTCCFCVPIRNLVRLLIPQTVWIDGWQCRTRQTCIRVHCTEGLLNQLYEIWFDIICCLYTRVCVCMCVCATQCYEKHLILLGTWHSNKPWLW